MMLNFERKTLIFLFVYCSFAFTFNELLSLFIPKLFYRGIYIVILLLCLLIITIGQKGILFFRKIDLLVAFYFLYMICRWLTQLASENYTSATFTSALQSCIPVLFYFVAIYLTQENANKIEYAFSWFATISIIMGFLNSRLHFLPSVGSFSGNLLAYVGTSGAVSVRGYSMGGSALVTGYISALLVGFSLGNENWKKSRKWLFFLVGWGGIASSLSRGAIAMLIIMLIYYSISKFEANKHLIRKKNVQRFLAIFIFFCFIFVMNINRITNSALWGRLIGLNISDNAARSGDQRNALIQAFKTPIFGRGFGFTGYQASLEGISNGINTESYFLSLLIGLGIVGSFLFTLILVYSLYFAAKTIKAKGQNVSEMYKYGSIIFGIGAWSIMYILLDADLNAIFFWYCIGRVMNNNFDE